LDEYTTEGSGAAEKLAIVFALAYDNLQIGIIAERVVLAEAR
jgi:hypothetical protein